MRVEGHLRRVASQIVDAKDGFLGVNQAKRRFSAILSKTEAEVREHSFSRLQRLLVHAYQATHHYRMAFDEAGFDPHQVKDCGDLRRIPTLSRETLHESKLAMISDSYAQASLIQSHTGGTNGTPIAFYQNRECSVQRIGRRLSILELCGYYRGDRCAWIWGVHSDLDSRPQRPWHHLKGRFRKFAVAKETLCCTSLTPDLMDAYHRRLLRFKPKVLYGYPNAMSHFAEFLKSHNLSPIKVETIICTAERLTEQQRQSLNEVFGGEVYNIYATREHGFVGFECRRHRGFHIDWGNVFLEILKEGNPVPAGETGEIVITDLWNYGMPIVRYSIGDVGRLSTRMCECGLPLPLLESFDGRTTDAVFRPDGTRVDGVILVDLFTDNRSIRAMQIVQQRMQGIDLNLVVTPDYDHDTERQILHEVRKYMGGESEIAVHLLPDIPRNPQSGKYQHVICRISPPNGFKRK